MPETQELPAHVTMPLLELITRNAMDDEYAQVDRQRGTRPPTVGTLAAGVVLAIVGLLFVTALVETDRDAGTSASGRAALQEEISSRRTEFADLTERAGKLRSINLGLQSELERETGQAAAAQERLQALKASAGYASVSGPGVRIEVDDPKSGLPDNAVRDEDLAILANALWRAGAEAISINGRRLTVLSAIRNSGRAINVNDSPISPPYVILAIGDPKTLPARVADSAHGVRWFDLVERLGFSYRLTTVGSGAGPLQLPAATPRRLRHVRTVRVAGAGVDPDSKEEAGP